MIVVSRAYVREYVKGALHLEACRLALLAVAIDAVDYISLATTMQSMADRLSRRIAGVLWPAVGGSTRQGPRAGHPLGRALSAGERALLSRDFGRALSSYGRPAPRLR